MVVRCTICQHPRSPEIVQTYLRTHSLRFTASFWKVGYKSLDRHLAECVARIYSEEEERIFNERLEQAINVVTARLNARFNAPRLDQRRPRPKSIITKPKPCVEPQKQTKAAREGMQVSQNKTNQQTDENA